MSRKQKKMEGRHIGDVHGGGRIFACVSASDPASIRNGLVDVLALAGVRLGVIQLAGTDLQKARITRHAAGFTDAA